MSIKKWTKRVLIGVGGVVVTLGVALLGVTAAYQAVQRKAPESIRQMEGVHDG